MNIFDRVEKQGFMLMEAFQSFRDLLKHIESQGLRPGAMDMEDDYENSDPRALMLEEISEKENEYAELCGHEDEYSDDHLYDDIEPEEGEYLPGYQAFPGRKTFKLSDIDANDPAFWGGKEIGIPLNLAVRLTPDQGLAVPMARYPRFLEE